MSSWNKRSYYVCDLNRAYIRIYIYIYIYIYIIWMVNTTMKGTIILFMRRESNLILYNWSNVEFWWRLYDKAPTYPAIMIKIGTACHIWNGAPVINNNSLGQVCSKITEIIAKPFKMSIWSRWTCPCVMVIPHSSNMSVYHILDIKSSLVLCFIQ
jgi:hypothetical protein